MLQTNENEVTDEEEELVHQISLYVQLDEHVQQVIDEQFLVQCWPNMAQGLVSNQDNKFTNIMSKTLSKTISTGRDPSENEIQKRVLDLMVPMDPMIVSNEPANEIPEDMVIPESESKSKNVQSLPKASGWMELIDANSEDTLVDSVEVGSSVSLIIRLRQVASLDTMLSTCTAHSGDDFYDLTNFRGCSNDLDILPNFKAIFNSRTGVKRLTTSFPMFKFPDETKVIIRCTVMVCNKNCPVAKCDQSKVDFKEVNIIDKFYLETFAEVYDVEAAAKGRKGHEHHYNQVQRTPLRAEMAETDKNYSHKALHSLEVSEAAAAASSAAASKESVEVVEQSGDLLCLSPSRLALAFGILLVVLLLALLASCTMWMRARSHLKRPKAVMRSPRPGPPPPHNALVPSQPRGPFIVASRPSYIRVLT